MDVRVEIVDLVVRVPRGLHPILTSLVAEIRRQDEKHGPYGVQGGTPLGVSRLALASLEDEVAEALQAWRDERARPDWPDTRAEVLQVAAVAVRSLRDALPGRTQ
jgi:hypothetical protein